MKRITVILGILLFFLVQIKAQTFPPGFSQVKVGNVYYPSAMAFAPDGRIFVTEKAGKVKIIKNNVVLAKPFLTVKVDELNERGLDGIILDPDFETNQYVYIYYTTAEAPIHNRLVRVTANGDVVVPGSEVPILDLEPLANTIHEGGGMVFGPDGYLYLGVGDDRVSANAQDLNVHKGKILRINKDGSPAPGNPFTGSISARRTWALGLRNPYTLAIQPETFKIFTIDVGESNWEEINDITEGGKNFGWPAAEGYSSNAKYTNPVYAYPHGEGDSLGCGITGGCFYNPVKSNYPAEYTGKYFFIDYCGNWINYIDFSGTVTSKSFSTGLSGSSVIITHGPDGNLYYLSISDDALYRIVYGNGGLSVSENASLPGILNICPNPNTGTFQVKFNKKIKGDIHIEIQNILGATIYSKEVTNSSSNSLTIDLQNIQYKGVCHLKLTAENSASFFKFIIAE